MSQQNCFALALMLGLELVPGGGRVAAWAEEAPAVATRGTSGSAARDSNDGQAPSARPVDAKAAAAKTADELRRRFRAALRASVRELAKAPYAEARAMVDLLIELRSDESLPSAERERFQNQLRTRLAQVRGAIVRSVRRQQAVAARAGRKDEGPESQALPSAASRSEALSSATGSGGESLATGPSAGRPTGGGAQPNEAAELIELIETTIAPESWEARGGPGVIKYWAPGMALVIRQTDEVHEQIGGLRRGLRH